MAISDAGIAQGFSKKLHESLIRDNILPLGLKTISQISKH